MRQGALVIQAAYRGHLVRKKYQRMRRGIVALQAVYRYKSDIN